MKNYLARFVSKSPLSVDLKDLKIADPGLQLLKSFFQNGAPVKLKGCVTVDDATWEDVELTGEIIRHRSDKEGVRFEWKW